MTNELKAIRLVLNQIDVHGVDNMSKMIGCIKMLDELIENARKNEEEVDAK